ncbi:S24 family peptidase [Paludibacterium yongneupense]|uniref:S24 family peptidase n=1 Tax=Paludibacterium yongneupense TaxID=400061 RepID=UPI000491C5BE|nr:S24 family peptidase [Paludibacterium yongneupense]
MDTVQNRRARLREWIDLKCDGSQARFVSLTGINQGELSGLLKSKSFGEKKARALEAQAGMPRMFLDQLETPRSAADLGPAIQTPLRPVVVLGEEDEVPDDVIAIPRYTVRASAGYGAPVLDVDVKGTPNFCRAAWAQRNGYKPGQLFSIVTIGDSMEPTIPEGASLIVHRQEEIVNGKIHIICRGNECFVKRLYKQLDGSVLIHSDNEKLYKDMEARPGDPDVLHVVGLVVSMSANL